MVDAPSSGRVSDAVLDRGLASQREALAARLDRLVTACLECIQETGDANPPLDAILRRARVPLKSFYRLFSTKDELILAVMERGVGDILDEIAAAAAGAAGPAEEVDAWVTAMVRHALARPAGTPTSLLGRQSALRERFPEATDALIDRLTGPLALAVGRLRDDADVRDDVRLVYWMVCGFIGDRTLVAPTRPLTEADLGSLRRAVRRVAVGPADRTRPTRSRRRTP